MIVALIMISGCLSLMFPTIYALSLDGLGEDAKFGAAGLVMAILGGAIMPLLESDSNCLRDSHTPALRPYGYVAGQGLLQDLVEGQGRRPRPSTRSCTRPRPGNISRGRGMGCDYNIITGFQKF